MDKQPIAVIENYQDEDPTHPNAFARFHGRMLQGVDAAAYSLVVLDSATMATLAARKWHQYVINPNPSAVVGQAGTVKKGDSFDPRQWYGGATDLMEEMLVSRFGALRTNVVVLAHVSEKKDEYAGAMVRNIALPGRLSDADEAAAGYNAVYRLYAARDEKKQLYRALQTQPDDRYFALNCIRTPDPCYPSWASLWQGWNGKRQTLLHAIVYGRSGAGKSTLAADCIRELYAATGLPALVFLFDQVMKAMPYREELGEVVEQWVDERGTLVEVVGG